MSRTFNTSLSEERLQLSELRPDTPAIAQTTGTATGLSQSFTGDTDMSQLLRMRKRRRLPPILLQKRPNLRRNFWPTYRGAVEWLRKREDDLNIALSLLELYPNLIQEAPMDGLWEFLRPLLSQLPFQAAVTKKNGFLRLSHPPETLGENGKTLNRNVPSISVTSPTGQARTPSVSSAESKLAYVCGKSKSLVNVISNEISPFLFTKVDTGQLKVSQEVSVDEESDITNSKVFIFVISKEAIEDVLTTSKLWTAILNSVPVLYVREADFSLQTPLPDFVFKLSTDHNEPKLLRENYGLLNRTRSVTPSIPVVKHSGHRQLRTTVPRPVHRTQSGRQRKKSSDEKFSNLGLQIMEGYTTAIAYDVQYHEKFVRSVFDGLAKLIGQGFVDVAYENTGGSSMLNRKESLLSVTTPNVETKSSLTNRLQVPELRKSVGVDDDSPMSEYGSYDEGLDHVFDDDLDNVDEWIIPGIDSGTSSPVEKETTYVIYPEPENRADNGPRMVKWPPKANSAPVSIRESDEYHLSFDSPVGFENVNFDIVLDPDTSL